jgi:hypothetical protein
VLFLLSGEYKHCTVRMTASGLGPYTVEGCVINASGYIVLLSEIILRILFLSANEIFISALSVGKVSYRK